MDQSDPEENKNFPDPENDPQLKLKLLQVEKEFSADCPDSRKGMRYASCGCLLFGGLALPLLKLGTDWKTFLLIAVFAVAGAVLCGLAGAYRPVKK
jgi:hypothetical protein